VADQASYIDLAMVSKTTLQCMKQLTTYNYEYSKNLNIKYLIKEGLN
jgi:hypothetical protein